MSCTGVETPHAQAFLSLQSSPGVAQSSVPTGTAAQAGIVHLVQTGHGALPPPLLELDEELLLLLLEEPPAPPMFPLLELEEPVKMVPPVPSPPPEDEDDEDDDISPPAPLEVDAGTVTVPLSSRPHAATSEEVTITTSGGLGEAETAGVVVNLVPKEGGNTFSGSLFGTGATEGMVSSNYDQSLQDLGLRAPNKVKNVFDYEGTLGGPVLRDRLWFFFNSRYHGASNYVAGMFVNRNAGDPTAWSFDPDFACNG